MSSGQVVLLGAIAGLTIFLGLPIGRAPAKMPTTKVVLNALAVGILIFLLWDILAHAWEPIDGSLADGDLGPAAANGLILMAGLGIGLIGLVWFDRYMAGRARAATDAEDPAAAAQRLALLIAIGIGLHNFAEGLAIGSSAASGELTLAWLLVIGFATHNATEGFGIIAPLSAAGVKPSWARLGMLGVIGGVPTLVGTVVGQHATAEPASVAFLALAAGSILYVVIELLAVLRRYARKYAATWGLFAGLVLGFLTDAILTASGA